MDLTKLDTLPELNDLMQQARQHDVEQYLLDFVVYGFTVIPPEKLGSSDLTDKLRTAILNVYEQRTGHNIDDWRTYSGELKAHDVWGWILEDDAFLEAINNPVFKLMGYFITGKTGFIAGSAAQLQTQAHSCDLPLQRETHGVPDGTYPFCANAAWLLTDNLSPEDGATMLVKNESNRPSNSDDQPIPLLGEAGSLVIWDGTIWHETQARKQPGLQIALIHCWERIFMRRMEPEHDISAEQLERWPDLPDLLGYQRAFPLRKGLTAAHSARHLDAGRDQYV